MKKYLIFVLCLFPAGAFAQEKQLCITVDDLPTVTNGIDDYDFRMSITKGIVQTFEKYAVPAIGYVNERKLYTDGVRDEDEVALLEVWLENGLDLGNHTFAHLNYQQVAFEEFTDGILKGEEVTRPLAAGYDREYRYFRHPYLRIGRDRAHYDSLNAFLAAHGYTAAPVTIDNTDYLFAAAYTKAYTDGDKSLMKKIETDYISYMEQKLVYYEQQSMKLFDRLIAQTLLIHANYLNAQCLEELIRMYKRHGYIFVSQTDVLKDPAYGEEITVFGNWGISWLDSWALSKGKKGDFFENDPPTPEYIEELARQ